MIRFSPPRPFAAAVVLLALGGLAACNKAPAEVAARPDRPVNVATVHFAPVSAPRTLVGVVRARTESNLGFRVAGKIAERLVDRGALVKAGQPLATLDQTDLRLQLQQAEAALSSAQAARDQTVAERGRITALRGRGWSTNSDLDKANADRRPGHRQLRPGHQGRHTRLRTPCPTQRADCRCRRHVVSCDPRRAGPGRDLRPARRQPRTGPMPARPDDVDSTENAGRQGP